MRDRDRSIGRVEVALCIFATPLVASLGALAFRSELAEIMPVHTQSFEIVAGASAIGLLVTILIGWLGDRRAVRKQETVLRDQEAELALKRQKLEAQGKQHELTLALKRLEWEKEAAFRPHLDLERDQDQPAGAPVTPVTDEDAMTPATDDPPVTDERPFRL